MPIVYLGIGSNLGSRELNCAKAIELLKRDGLKITRKSSLYETEPWGLTAQPKFINMAIEAEADLAPRGLLALIKKIENEMGRMPGVRWGPRLIDIDILLYDEQIIDDPDLKIPHPMMHERRFVLEPLAEIAPGKVHPVLQKKILELLAEA